MVPRRSGATRRYFAGTGSALRIYKTGRPARMASSEQRQLFSGLVCREWPDQGRGRVPAEVGFARSHRKRQARGETHGFAKPFVSGRETRAAGWDHRDPDGAWGIGGESIL